MYQIPSTSHYAPLHSEVGYKLRVTFIWSALHSFFTSEGDRNRNLETKCFQANEDLFSNKKKMQYSFQGVCFALFCSGFSPIFFTFWKEIFHFLL